MNLLAIETSCDETAAAVIAETGDPVKPWAIASNIVASQTAIHREWAALFPNWRRVSTSGTSAAWSKRHCKPRR